MIVILVSLVIGLCWGFSRVGKVKAVENGLSFKAGWNYLIWKSEWTANFAFDSLPIACPYVVYRKDSWFYSFVRNFSKPENFQTGRSYFVYCLQETYWGMN